MFARSSFGIFAAAALWTAARACADDQVIELQGDGAQSEISSRPIPFLFVERLAFALDRRADHVFTDKLHPFNAVRWSLDLHGPRSDDFREHTESAARGALSKSIAYGIRDTFAESPFMVWLEDRQEVLAAFLRDSIDGVEEESISPLDASYGLVERSWWRSLRRNGAFRYGVRPFRTNPYAFSSFAVKDEQQVYFLGHVRYYYADFTDHRFEVATSIPLTHGFAFDVGTSYQFTGRKAPAQLAMKVFKELKSGGIAHVGVEFRDRTIFLAGLTFGW